MQTKPLAQLYANGFVFIKSHNRAWPRWARSVYGHTTVVDDDLTRVNSIAVLIPQSEGNGIGRICTGKTISSDITCYPIGYFVKCPSGISVINKQVGSVDAISQKINGYQDIRCYRPSPSSLRGGWFQ